MLPAATPRCQALIEHAREAMRRLADVPTAAELAREAGEQIDLYWKHTPLTVAVAGHLAARTAVLNVLAGEALFHPSRREAGGMVLTISRGTVLSCRARRRDGSVEEMALPPEVVGESMIESIRDATAPGDDSIAAASIAAASITAASIAPPAPPALVPLEHRSLWRRLVDWLRALFGRARDRRAPQPALPGPPAPPGRVERRSTATPPRPQSTARRRFIDDLRALLDASSRGADVERVFVEIDVAPLPRGVVAVEVPSIDGARWLGLADGCLLACEPGAALSAADRALIEAARTRVPHVFVITAEDQPRRPPPAPDPAVRHAGACASIVPRLPDLLLTERALRLSAGAHAALQRALPVIDQGIARLEGQARARLPRLDALRIGDPAAFVATRLDRLRGRASERTHRLIRRTTEHLTELLDRRETAWKSMLRGALSGDDLRAAIALIDDEWPRVSADAIEDVRRQVRRDLAVTADEVLAPFFAELAEVVDGAPAAAPTATARDVDVAMSWGTAASGARGDLVGLASRLTTLLRSVETMKEEAIERLGAGLAKARSRSAADLLDAEPLLRDAAEGPLRQILEPALAAHLARVAALLADEEAALARDQAALEALHRMRAVVRDDEQRLVDLVLLAEADLGLQLAEPAR